MNLKSNILYSQLGSWMEMAGAVYYVLPFTPKQKTKYCLVCANLLQNFSRFLLKMYICTSYNTGT